MDLILKQLRLHGIAATVPSKAVALLGLGLALASGLLVGCTDPGPLDDDQPRTPYTQYRELRGDDPPLTTEDTLGNERPNLRGRLLKP